MAKIDYEVNNFAAGVLKVPGPVVAPSKLELMVAAARVGDSGVLSGHSRPLAEVMWRAAMVDAALTEIDLDGTQRWAKSESFSRLDPSEKTSISYFLGMLQASVVAKKLLGLSDIVHVDAALALRHISPVRSRPDLVGYQTRPGGAFTNGRVLIEAKGRSNGADNRALARAKTQVADPSTVARALVGANPLLVASMAYFASSEAWCCIFEDPPTDGKVTPLVEDDAAFRGLLNIASLRPVAHAISQLREFAPARVESSASTGMTVAALPGQEWAVGMPTEVLSRVLEMTGPPVDPSPVDNLGAAGWAQGIEARRQVAPELRENVGTAHEADFSDFHLDEDGLFIAELRPETEMFERLDE